MTAVASIGQATERQPADPFETVSRQTFRRIFQPSRIVLALVPAAPPSPLAAPGSAGVNVLTVCFHMHCSYRPPMMAFAVHRTKYSYELFQQASECVLAVPGESLVRETLLCGSRSGRELDKVDACGLELVESREIAVPGLAAAIANVEMRIAQRHDSGDCQIVVGEILRFAQRRGCGERNLLSIGPDLRGYDLLMRDGIHRLGVAANPPAIGRAGK